MSFFRILAYPGAKTLDFGTPLAPSWAPNDAQNRPSGAKKPQKKHKMVLTFADLLLGSFLERCPAPFPSIWGSPGHQNYGFSHDVLIIFERFFATGNF